MNARQHFKLAVLNLLADRGLTLDEIKQEVKTAADRLEKQAGPIWTAIKASLPGASESLVGNTLGGIKELFKNVGTAGLVAPPAIGAGLGYAAAKLTESGGPDVEDANDMESISHYHQLAQQARRNAELHRRQREVRPSFSRI